MPTVLYSAGGVCLAIIIALVASKRIRRRRAPQAFEAERRHAIEQNVYDSIALFRNFVAAHRGFIVVALSVGILPACIMFAAALYITEDVEKALSATGSLVTICAASGTLVSVLNTAKILRNQGSLLTSYNGLLQHLNSEFEQIASRARRKDNRVELRICTPTLALGNISADTEQFHRFKHHLNELETSGHLALQVCMRSDFSAWQMGFIRRRFDVISDVFSPRREKSVDEHKRQVDSALHFLESDFDHAWWNELRDSNIDFLSIDLRQKLAADLAQVTRDLVQEIKNMRTPPSVALPAEIGRKITALRHAAHTNADFQVVSLLLANRNEQIRLMTGSLAVFPPCIAISLATIDYVCWIRPSSRGTKNELTGTVSVAGQGIRVVDELLSYYAASYELGLPPTDADAKSIDVVEFLKEWENDSVMMQQFDNNVVANPLELLEPNMGGNVFVKYRQSALLEVIQKCLHSVLH